MPYTGKAGQTYHIAYSGCGEGTAARLFFHSDFQEGRGKTMEKKGGKRIKLAKVNSTFLLTIRDILGSHTIIQIYKIHTVIFMISLPKVASKWTGRIADLQ